MDDADVPAFWQGLGLPGLFDIHVHFLPPAVQARVWEHFDQAGPLIGRAWPIAYRGSQDERVATLRALGVCRFTALPYAHRPGIAEYLNDWAAGFAIDVPEALTCATFFPEPGVTHYVEERLSTTDVFKVHVQVGDFDLADPRLAEVWGLLAEAGTPVVIHAGSGPVPNSHTGPGPLEVVLRRQPRLTAVVAHLGAPEYAEFLALAARFERVHLDTTMAFTDFFTAMAPFPDGLLSRLVDLGDRVLLGSDFPTIPYPYAHQLEALARLGLGDDWLRRVCWSNAETLLTRAPT